MVRYFIPFALLLLSSVAAADALELAVQTHQAKALFDSRRYSDAEQAFTRIREASLPLTPAGLDNYLTVLDYLARSISEQGKSAGVRTLLEERHVLIARHYDARGYVYATSMSRLAEALYREGNRSRALSFIDYAINSYQKLNPVPEKSLAMAESNRLQYKVAEFNRSMLPMDLSDFYTRCERLNSADSDADSTTVMANYVEVGVDFIPRGQWVQYFAEVLRQHESRQHDSDNPRSHRIFLPHSSEQMRGDLCLVAAPSKALLNAESQFD